jgi:hypothetical protein
MPPPGQPPVLPPPSTYPSAATQKPAKARNAKADRLPSGFVVVLGVLMILLSPLTLFGLTYLSAGPVIEAFQSSIALIPAEGTVEFKLTAGSYSAWSSEATWPENCTLASGGETTIEGDAKGLKAANKPLLIKGMDVNLLGDFTATGGSALLSCDAPASGASMTAVYLLPSFGGMTLVWPLIGGIAGAVLLLVGLVLFSVQSIRRAKWLGKHLPKPAAASQQGPSGKSAA